MYQKLHIRHTRICSRRMVSAIIGFGGFADRMRSRWLPQSSFSKIVMHGPLVKLARCTHARCRLQAASILHVAASARACVRLATFASGSFGITISEKLEYHDGGHDAPRWFIKFAEASTKAGLYYESCRYALRAVFLRIATMPNSCQIILVHGILQVDIGLIREHQIRGAVSNGMYGTTCAQPLLSRSSLDWITTTPFKTMNAGVPPICSSFRQRSSSHCCR